LAQFSIPDCRSGMQYLCPGGLVLSGFSFHFSFSFLVAILATHHISLDLGVYGRLSETVIVIVEYLEGEEQLRGGLYIGLRGFGISRARTMSGNPCHMQPVNFVYNSKSSTPPGI
jgi:hypothetical protein